MRLPERRPLNATTHSDGVCLPRKVRDPSLRPRAALAIRTALWHSQQVAAVSGNAGAWRVIDADGLSYREHEVVAPLRPYVHSIWEMRAPCTDQAPQSILPDGCISLVLTFESSLERVADNGNAPLPRTMLLGELRRPMTMRSLGPLGLLGVRFWPGSVRAFLDTPVIDVVDAVCDDAVLARGLARSIERSVHGADPDERAATVQRALVEQLLRTRGRNRLVTAAVGHLVQADGRLTIEALADNLGVSRRNLERAFGQEVGVSPKQLAGVLRFRRLLRLVGRPRADWASVALDCGYYDQAHLVRDFRRYTGSTPMAFGGPAHSVASVGLDSDVA